MWNGHESNLISINTDIRPQQEWDIQEHLQETIVAQEDRGEP